MFGVLNNRETGGIMFSLAQELRMQRAYELACRQLLGSQNQYVQSGNLVGLETEVGLYNPTLSHGQVGTVRDEVMTQVGGTYELGLHQLEVSPLPVSLDGGFGAVVAGHRSVSEHIARACRERGVSLVRCGTNPFLHGLQPPRTNTPKYQRVPDFQDLHRRKDLVCVVGGVDVDAAVVSLCQAFQINVQARSFEHGINLLNYSFMAGPYLLVLAANARYVQCSDTGFADVRMHAWQLTHDTRTRRQLRKGYGPRVGLPERYFGSVSDYLQRIARFPFILDNPDAALQIAIGMTWLDARIKFIEQSVVVELRNLPTQAEWEDEVALTAAYLGMLAYCDHYRLPLMPIDRVADNRMSAMQYGLNGRMWLDGEQASAAHATEVWLCRAEEGLRLRGLHDACVWLERLYSRLKVGCPSEQLAGMLERNPRPTEQQLAAAMQALNMLQ